MEQSRADGLACVSCAWTKPEKGHLFEFCENGAKATLRENTPLRCAPDFFAAHAVSELRDWSDHDLEQQGPPDPSPAWCTWRRGWACDARSLTAAPW
jgi:hypothetical protein